MPRGSSWTRGWRSTTSTRTLCGARSGPINAGQVPPKGSSLRPFRYLPYFDSQIGPMVPGESRLYSECYLRRPFAVRTYRAHWWRVIYVGEHAADTLAHVSVNAGRLCRDGHGVSFNGTDLCAAPQRLPRRDPATRSLDHHDFTALGRRSGDPADIREAPVYLLLGLALGSVWSRTDDQRVDPGGSGPSHRGVGRAQRSPFPREAPRTSHSHLCTKV